MTGLTPLANDPVSLTTYATSLGVEPGSFQFAELFEFNEEILDFFPRPIHATIFLFPLGKPGSPVYDRHLDAEPAVEPVPWFTRQKVGCACGTIAMIHAIMNNTGNLSIRDDSWIARFIERTKGLNPEECGAVIASSQDLHAMHEDQAVGDGSPVRDQSFTSHFAAFVCHGGNLWELDGIKPHAFCHGPCNDVLSGSFAVIKREILPHIENVMECAMCMMSPPTG